MREDGRVVQRPLITITVSYENAINLEANVFINHHADPLCTGHGTETIRNYRHVEYRLATYRSGMPKSSRRRRLYITQAIITRRPTSWKEDVHGVSTQP